MTELESIGKLRKYVHDYPKGIGTYTVYSRMQELTEIADAIQDEVDSRFMELPLDADGVPIRVGDKIHRTTSAVDKVVDVIGVNKREFFFNAPNFMEPGIKKNVGNAVRHVKPTVEDVLREFGDWYAYTKGGCDEDSVMAKYADQLRGMIATEEG